MKTEGFTLRPMSEGDSAWVQAAMRSEWSSERVAVHGKIYEPANLPGWVAEAEDKPVGLLTYAIEGDACEIVTLNAWWEKHGVGSALIQAARRTAVEAGCRRMWLVTTNDNTPALRFYQKRGFHLAGIRVNGVEESRKLKAEIPLLGLDGIEIRDEMTLEMNIDGTGDK